MSENKGPKIVNHPGDDHWQLIAIKDDDFYVEVEMRGSNIEVMANNNKTGIGSEADFKLAKVVSLTSRLTLAEAAVEAGRDYLSEGLQCDLIDDGPCTYCTLVDALEAYDKVKGGE